MSMDDEEVYIKQLGEHKFCWAEIAKADIVRKTQFFSRHKKTYLKPKFGS